MDMIAAVETSYDRLGKLVAGIAPDALDDPTPLEGWDVLMTDAAKGRPFGEPPTDLIGDHATKVVADVIQESLEAWRRPGVLEETVASPLGDMPGEAALSLVVMETTVHGTDLARATGQDESVDPVVAEIVLETLRGMPLDAVRDAGSFGPEVSVPDESAAIDLALGLTGRRP
jgi:uncharacterized protein (TIGR03086 family)